MVMDSLSFIRRRAEGYGDGNDYKLVNFPLIFNLTTFMFSEYKPNLG